MSEPKMPKYDDPDVFTWEERFRDALTRANEVEVAKVLRQSNSLGRSTIEVLANLFEGSKDDAEQWKEMYPYRLKFVQRKPGARKNLENNWVRDAQIRKWVVERLVNTKRGARKAVIVDAMKEFCLGRTAVETAIARSKRRNRSRSSMES
jgi:hypothetical protein